MRSSGETCIGWREEFKIHSILKRYFPIGRFYYSFQRQGHSMSKEHGANSENCDKHKTRFYIGAKFAIRSIYCRYDINFWWYFSHSVWCEWAGVLISDKHWNRLTHLRFKNVIDLHDDMIHLILTAFCPIRVHILQFRMTFDAANDQRTHKSLDDYP